MESAEQVSHIEDTYKAIGRFVVEFSTLLASLDGGTLRLIGGIRAIGNPLLMALLADRTALPIVSSFFAVFGECWKDRMKSEEKRLISLLRKELQELVEERNRLMHDVWMTQYVEGEPGPYDMARVRNRASKEGMEYEISDFGPNRLNGLTDDAIRLAEVVSGLAHYCGDDSTPLNLTSKIVEDGKKVRWIGRLDDLGVRRSI